MAADGTDVEQDPELTAMQQVYAALKGLDSDAQNRVLEYVERRLGLLRSGRASMSREQPPAIAPSVREESFTSVQTQAVPAHEEPSSDGAESGELEGISPVARRWMQRNDLSASRVSALFSLGVDEIDLVATRVPGGSARERLHNVILLQGIASYLNTGSPRIDNDKLREAMRHYDADVGTNFNRDVKHWAAEVAGSRAASDLTLTTRGLNAARDLIREMTEGD